jgi:hypothetical protein
MLSDGYGVLRFFGTIKKGLVPRIDLLGNGVSVEWH